MGFFSFVKNIGRKIAGAGKIVLGKGKSLLKTGVSIGNKVVNNPIVSRIVDIATPLLSTNPYGRAVLLGIKGAQKGLEIGDKLLEGIDTAERVAKSIQKPGQSKDQTKLIAQGIEKGISEYKKQQKIKERDPSMREHWSSHAA